MKFYVKEECLKSEKITFLQFKNNTWYAFSLNHELRENDDQSDFVEVSKIKFIELIPNVKSHLNQKDGTTININPDNSELNINIEHKEFGINYYSAKATRQVNSSFSLVKWVLNNKRRYKRYLLFTVSFVLLSLFIHWLFWIPILIYTIVEVLITLKDRDSFKVGALCPAIVINTNPIKIATYTNLSLGFGSYPILCIQEVSLPKDWIELEKRIPVSGGYAKTENYSFWNFFEAKPIPNGIKEASDINKLLDLIPEIEWHHLEKHYKKLPNKSEAGYYPLDIENSNWSSIELSTIKWVKS